MGQSSAIVVGGSMGGLLAARVLSNHFHSVTIVERDELPRAAAVRKGVPQGAHGHGLLASGYRALDEYFPALMDELEALGALRADVVGTFLWFQYGRWKLRHNSGLRGITVSRPGLETAVRHRVAALRNVTLLEGTDAVKPTFDAARGRVSGLEVRSRATNAPSMLQADLVVDATGRGSQAPKWLEEWGFTPPSTETVRVDVGYSTRIFERRPGEFFDSAGGIIAGTPPESRRMGAVLAAEGDRWVITLIGCLRDYPPEDERGWLEFAASLPVSAVYDLATTARPLSGITTFRFPANQRRRYERMARFPAGFLVVGDGICSFNPIYGQGMSVAAMEAKTLDETLATSADHLAKRFFSRASAIVDIPWTIATGEDLRYPAVAGKRPIGFHLVNRYMERVHAMASEDPEICRRFFDVLNLLAPPTSLMTPRIAWRVLSHKAKRDQGTPWGVSRNEERRTKNEELAASGNPGAREPVNPCTREPVHL
jgi:2-polyprenyl-6-methoxyphenol hydroxylase-like FAD-dependent oxidoreductase